MMYNTLSCYLIIQLARFIHFLKQWPTFEVVSTSELQGPQFNPELRLLSIGYSTPFCAGFLQVHWFPPPSPKHAKKWTGNSKMTLGVNRFLSVCMCSDEPLLRMKPVNVSGKNIFYLLILLILLGWQEIDLGFDLTILLPFPHDIIIIGINKRFSM